MRAKYSLAIMFLAMMLAASPVFAFWHPEEPPVCIYPKDSGPAVFGVLINGLGTKPFDPFIYNFTEPVDNFCDDVKVEVWIFNVTDLYAYEFVLYWDNVIFNLKGWVVEKVWTPNNLTVFDDIIAPNAYKQVATAYSPSPGVNGNIKLATLTFHIMNDACWTLAFKNYVNAFILGGLKASDSCTAEISLCDPLNGWWRFKPVQPTIYLTPAPEEVNWKVGDKFTETVWVENITKMKSIHFTLKWWWYVHVRLLKDGTWDVAYNPLIKTSDAAITVNEEVFPEDKALTYNVVLTEGTWDPVEGNNFDTITVDIEMKCTYPLINSTLGVPLKIMDVVFTKKDPWYCGRQPLYTYDTKKCTWIPQNASTPINITGYFDVWCPSTDNIYFNPGWGDVTGQLNYANVKINKYVFMPVPGDLDGSGVVDIKDLTIIASLYGLNWVTDPYLGTYYDFNVDCEIDIFDIVLVAKNMDRNHP